MGFSSRQHFDHGVTLSHRSRQTHGLNKLDMPVSRNSNLHSMKGNTPQKSPALDETQLGTSGQADSRSCANYYPKIFQAGLS